MKVEGLKLLDANFYHQLTVRGDKIVVQRLDKSGRMVTCDDLVQKVKSANPISRELRHLDTRESIDRVVEYYLDYSKITGIYTNASFNRDLYCVLTSSIGDEDLIHKGARKLRFQEAPDQRTFQRIVDKYHLDREVFLLNLVDDVSYFEFYFDKGNSSYQVRDFYEGKKKGCFTLRLEEASSYRLDLPPDEEEFLEKAVDIIMGDEIAISRVDEDWDRFGFLERRYMRIDSERYGKTITVSQVEKSRIEDIVSKHNMGVWERRHKQEKAEGKVYQLKMEGF